MENKKSIYALYWKRPLDFIIAFIALIIFSPIMLLVGGLIKFKLGSPIIFKQKRPGLKEEIFTMYKFRTMSDKKDKNGELLPDSLRLTRFGKMLRSSSLDELPELVNIIKGDMSIIGPRPLATQYLSFYNTNERKRHLVRPGLSGLAQVNGRNAVSWEERFDYDILYVENISFMGDLKIILKTIKVALKRENIGERGVDTQIDFDEYRREQEKCG